MRVCTAILLVAVLAGTASAQNLYDLITQTEQLKRLAGTWVAVEGRSAGKALTKDELAKVHFAANHFTAPPFGGAMIRLHPGGAGGRFFFLYGQNGLKAAGRAQGVYELKGDTLTVCADPVPGGGAFNAPLASIDEAKKTFRTVLTFKREKK